MYVCVLLFPSQNPTPIYLLPGIRYYEQTTVLYTENKRESVNEQSGVRTTGYYTCALTNKLVVCSWALGSSSISYVTTVRSSDHHSTAITSHLLQYCLVSFPKTTCYDVLEVWRECAGLGNPRVVACGGVVLVVVNGRGEGRGGRSWHVSRMPDPTQRRGTGRRIFVHKLFYWSHATKRASARKIHSD